MIKARAFFYVSGGLFLLALSYHLGARSAGAQAPGNPVISVAASSGTLVAVTANGDTYDMAPCCTNYVWTYRSNVFGGGPTPTAHETLGGLKVKYR